ncbi:Polysaccharide biosynthesis C-terminal domain protein [Acididesulfobacillus acetoxydans]|uniref:Polysaccharide biosynthesis C-terminal domain protein n=1 Tax=Acididesulfobacillus acetoxydans TaxID=1561005 RepID=A0A8S0XD54_9FIRM|nr:flippase [Acididesulfobacillus acetoxydans]CAA7603146.1 Polysaccharide biosynthesis C-terminal domain protein [Acididesulfobacillus acetoxydans]CEJ07626.1 Polysaccharide biosynthesis protein [Acididesulfobacillus acetoxydans]
MKLGEFIAGNGVVNRTVKNANWLVSQQVFNMVIGVVVIAFVARYFGPEKYGQYSFANAFVGLFTAVSTLGMEILTVKAIADDTFDDGTILGTSLLLRLCGGVLLTGLAMSIIKLTEPNDQHLHILVLIMSLTMIFKASEVIEYWLQAYQRAKFSALIRMGVNVVDALLKMAMIVFKGTLVTYALVYMLDALIIGIALFIVYRKIRETDSSWRISLSYAKGLLSQSWYLILSGLMVTLYMRIDQVMLGAMLPSKIELGIYSAAVRVAQMWYFVPMAIITSFNPVIMRRKSTDEAGYNSSVQALYTIVAWSGIGFGVLILLFSRAIIGILYGAAYMKAASILSISVWAGTFAMLGSARSLWLLREGLQRYTLIYTSSALVVNVILNLILIPRFGGYGAAFATLAAQIINVAVLGLFKDTRLSLLMIIKALSIKRLIRLRDYL